MIKLKITGFIPLFILSISACQNSTDNHLRHDRESAKEKSPALSRDGLSQQILGKSDGADTAANHPDHDFVHFMISQHEMALDLANEELDSSKDKMLKTVATHIIEHHQLEKDFLEKAANRIDTEEEQEGMASIPVLHYQLKSAIDKMQSGLREMEQVKDINLKFKNKIILHHQTSIDVAEAYLEFVKDKELLSYAERLIKDHKQEIRQLQNH